MKHLFHVQAIYPYNPNRTDPSWLQFQLGYGAQYHEQPDPFPARAYDQNLIAKIARDRASSHLAEQIGVKALVPLIAISSDHALSSVHIPWIFSPARRHLSRSGASDHNGRGAPVRSKPIKALRRTVIPNPDRRSAIPIYWGATLAKSR